MAVCSKQSFFMCSQTIFPWLFRWFFPIDLDYDTRYTDLSYSEQKLGRWKMPSQIGNIVFFFKLSPSQIFPRSNPIHAYSHPCFYSYWQLLKVPCKSINKWRVYTGDNILKKITKPPSKTKYPLDRFFWKSIPSMLLLLLITSQSM
jgi:hypothetical protein